MLGARQQAKRELACILWPQIAAHIRLAGRLAGERVNNARPVEQPDPDKQSRAAADEPFTRRAGGRFDLKTKIHH
jgi:hypothetical protein